MTLWTHLFWWDEDAVTADNPSGQQVWCSDPVNVDDGGLWGWCPHLSPRNGELRRCHAGPYPEHEQT